jgi:hypothetical protein
MMYDIKYVPVYGAIKLLPEMTLLRGPTPMSFEFWSTRFGWPMIFVAAEMVTVPEYLKKNDGA